MSKSPPAKKKEEPKRELTWAEQIAKAREGKLSARKIQPPGKPPKGAA